ncbi:hypothetical protein OSTOST_05604, partial [Ostertagia ostertagi]
MNVLKRITAGTGASLKSLKTARSDVTPEKVTVVVTEAPEKPKVSIKGLTLDETGAKTTSNEHTHGQDTTTTGTHETPQASRASAEADKPPEKPLGEAQKPLEKPLAEAQKPPEKTPAAAPKPAEKPPAAAPKPAEKPPAEEQKPLEKIAEEVESKRAQPELTHEEALGLKTVVVDDKKPVAKTELTTEQALAIKDVHVDDKKRVTQAKTEATTTDS